MKQIKIINIKLDEEILEVIQKEADHYHISIDDLISKVIYDYYQRIINKVKPTKYVDDISDFM